MKKIFIIVCLIFTLFCFGCASDTEVQSNEEEKTVTPIEIGTYELIEAYNANEIKADNLYKDQLLRIESEVSEISKDVMGDPYVFFSTDDLLDLEGVRCYITDEKELEKAAELQKGESIAVEGYCDGLATLYVGLSNCSIEPLDDVVDKSNEAMAPAELKNDENNDANNEQIPIDTTKEDLEKYLQDLNDLESLRKEACRAIYKLSYKKFLDDRGDDSSKVEANISDAEEFLEAYSSISSNIDLVKQMNNTRAGTKDEDSYKEYMKLRGELRELYRSYGYQYPYESGEAIYESGGKVKIYNYTYYGAGLENYGVGGAVLVPVEITNTSNKSMDISFYGISMVDVQGYTCNLHSIMGTAISSIAPNQTARADLIFVCRDAPEFINVKIEDSVYELRLLP